MRHPDYQTIKELVAEQVEYNKHLRDLDEQERFAMSCAYARESNGGFDPAELPGYKGDDEDYKGAAPLQNAHVSAWYNRPDQDIPF